MNTHETPADTPEPVLPSPEDISPTPGGMQTPGFVTIPNTPAKHERKHRP